VAGTFFHLALFGVGLYVLLRMLSRRPFPAWLGAVVGLGMFTLTHADHFPARLFTFSWTPLLFACYAGTWRTRRFSFFMGAALIFGVQVLGGHVEYLGRQSMFIFMVGLGILIFYPRELFIRRTAVAAIAVSAAAGLAIAAVQIVPTSELVNLTTRSVAEWFPYREFSYTAHPAQLVFFRIMLSAPVALAVWLAATKLRRLAAVKVAAVVFVVTIIFCVNLFGSLRLLYPLPVLGRMMWHHLGLSFLAIPLALVVALAVEYAAGHRSGRKLLVWLAVLCLFEAGLQGLESAMGAGKPGHYPLDNFLAFEAWSWFVPVAMGAVGLALAIPRFCRPRAAAAYVTAAVMLCHYVPVFFILHKEGGDWPVTNQAYLDYFSRPRPPGRVMTLAPPSHDRDRTIPYQVGSKKAPVRLAVTLKDEDEGGTRLVYARTLLPSPLQSEVTSIRIDLGRWRGRTVAVGFAAIPGEDGAELIITDPAVHLPDAHFQREDIDGVNVFVNTGALPRAFVAHSFRSIVDNESRLAYIGGPAFDPAVEVVLSEPFAGSLAGGRRRPLTPVKFVDYGHDRVELAIESAEPGLLVLSDVYYPGWRAEAGGGEVRILRANHAFRAVPVPAGRGRVAFSYQPASLRMGIWISIASLAWMAGLVVWRKGASKKFNTETRRHRGTEKSREEKK